VKGVKGLNEVFDWQMGNCHFLDRHFLDRQFFQIITFF